MIQENPRGLSVMYIKEGDNTLKIHLWSDVPTMYKHRGGEPGRNVTWELFRKEYILKKAHIH